MENCSGSISLLFIGTSLDGLWFQLLNLSILGGGWGVSELISSLHSGSKTVAVNTKAQVLDFAQHTQNCSASLCAPTTRNDCCVPQKSVVKSCNYRLSSRCANWFKLPCCHIRENKKSEVRKKQPELIKRQGAVCWLSSLCPSL